ncbi:major facilitator superfamily MFS_1 [Actinobacteria bacterium OK074]|nr:major facilitator superfamily MFS_1 [Actinobacteria bacterium OK074]
MAQSKPVPSPPRPSSGLSPRARRLFFTFFYTLSSFAEGGQAVVLLSVAYALTHNAFLIGLMVSLGYLPAAVLGLLFKRFADRGHADRVVRTTNTALSAVSLLLALQQLTSGDRVAWSITVIALSQVALSIAKMFNRAALNRVIRDRFTGDTSRSFLASSQSAALIGQITGAGLAGVALAGGWYTASLFGTALAYAASAGALSLGVRGQPAVPRREEPVPAGERARGRRDPALTAVLVFSVPSSGAREYLNALLVPLAAAVAPGQPSYYALLSIVTTCGGFLAGILLSTNAVSVPAVLGRALPATTVLAAGLAVSGSRPVVAVVGFGLSLAITVHMISMQVLTNQVPARHEVGEFAVVRNVVASLAKAGFSFAAGTLAGLWGVRTAALVLAASGAVFSLAWLVLRPLPEPAGQGLWPRGKART